MVSQTQTVLTVPMGSTLLLVSVPRLHNVPKPNTLWALSVKTVLLDVLGVSVVRNVLAVVRIIDLTLLGLVSLLIVLFRLPVVRESLNTKTGVKDVLLDVLLVAQVHNV